MPPAPEASDPGGLVRDHRVSRLGCVRLAPCGHPTAAFVEAEAPKWSTLVEQAGIKLE